MTQYQLSAEDTKIVFRDGEEDMTLEYNGQVFDGSTLHREQTALGRVISVVLETVPDLQTVFLSLVIPEANRAADMESIPVSTFAVITTERTSIGGPELVSGQLRNYKVVPLDGDAR